MAEKEISLDAGNENGFKTYTIIGEPGNTAVNDFAGDSFEYTQWVFEADANETSGFKVTTRGETMYGLATTIRDLIRGLQEDIKIRRNNSRTRGMLESTNTLVANNLSSISKINNGIGTVVYHSAYVGTKTIRNLLTYLDTNINTNTTNIATNTTNITTNINNITTNTTNIATNTSSIAVNMTEIASVKILKMWTTLWVTESQMWKVKLPH